QRDLLARASRLDRTGGAVRRATEARARGLRLRVVEELERALAVDPANPALLSEMGYAFYDLERRDLAYEYQRTALDVDPSFANAWYGLALVHRDAGRSRAAVTCFRRFLELEPEDAFAARARSEIARLTDAAAGRSRTPSDGVR
ncbi:MAG: tetratricopeptide repeat protein, partial [Thermoanaerobaculia bacterium]